MVRRQVRLLGIFKVLMLVVVLGFIGGSPLNCLPPEPSPRTGAWKATFSGTLYTSIDGVTQPEDCWGPVVSLQFDELGNLLAVSSLAPSLYYRVADGTRQAHMQKVGDEDISCVYSRLASSYERVVLTRLESDENSVHIEFESEFDGHVQITTMDGHSVQTIELSRQVDGLLCTVTYSGEHDLTEHAGPEAGVPHHYVETFTASATLTPADATEFEPYEDTCSN